MRSRIGPNGQGLGISSSAEVRFISVLVSTKNMKTWTYSESLGTFILEALTHQSESFVLVPGPLDDNW